MKPSPKAVIMFLVLFALGTMWHMGVLNNILSTGFKSNNFMEDPITLELLYLRNYIVGYNESNHVYIIKWMPPKVLTNRTIEQFVADGWVIVTQYVMAKHHYPTCVYWAITTDPNTKDVMEYYFAPPAALYNPNKLNKYGGFETKIISKYKSFYQLGVSFRDYLAPKPGDYVSMGYISLKYIPISIMRMCYYNNPITPEQAKRIAKWVAIQTYNYIVSDKPSWVTVIAALYNPRGFVALVDPVNKLVYYHNGHDNKLLRMWESKGIPAIRIDRMDYFEPQEMQKAIRIIEGEQKPVIIYS